jgi:tRNA-binding protein
MATIKDLQNLDIRVGKVIEVNDFPEARKPSYQLTIDFGNEIGKKKSSVQIVSQYTKNELKGKLVLGVVNLPPLQIGPFVSEVLVVGVPNKNNQCVLAVPDKDKVKIGGRLY